MPLLQLGLDLSLHLWRHRLQLLPVCDHHLAAICTPMPNMYTPVRTGVAVRATSKAVYRNVSKTKADKLLCYP